MSYQQTCSHTLSPHHHPTTPTYSVLGLWRLSLLTSLLSMLPLVLLFLLPTNSEEQRALAKSPERSRCGDVFFLLPFSLFFHLFSDTLVSPNQDWWCVVSHRASLVILPINSPYEHPPPQSSSTPPDITPSHASSPNQDWWCDVSHRASLVSLVGQRTSGVGTMDRVGQTCKNLA